VAAGRNEEDVEKSKLRWKSSISAPEEDTDDDDDQDSEEEELAIPKTFKTLKRRTNPAVLNPAFRMISDPKTSKRMCRSQFIERAFMREDE
jgi:hypothetical protein